MQRERGKSKSKRKESFLAYSGEKGGERDSIGEKVRKKRGKRSKMGKNTGKKSFQERGEKGKGGLC